MRTAEEWANELHDSLFDCAMGASMINTVKVIIGRVQAEALEIAARDCEAVRDTWGSAAQDCANRIRIRKSFIK